MPSSPPRPNTNGSPPLSRTTVSPRRPRSTSTRLMASCESATRPLAFPASTRSAPRGARSSRAAGASRSYTTTSARCSSSAPRNVTSRGSPGPAPTRNTIPPPPLLLRRAPGQAGQQAVVEAGGGQVALAGPDQVLQLVQVQGGPPARDRS